MPCDVVDRVHELFRTPTCMSESPKFVSFGYSGTSVNVDAISMEVLATSATVKNDSREMYLGLGRLEVSLSHEVVDRGLRFRKPNLLKIVLEGGNCAT